MTIYHFKILVPAAAAGRIIGKGGTTIAQLQKDAGARVKMSKASEFYPGTTERVCLISGPIEGILKINDFFMENFSSTSIKILVPNSTAGMIIGKGGSYIKQIKEESGAYVQISQKCTDLSLPERCVTIVGELDNIRKACAMILSKIVEDVAATSRDTRASSLTSTVMSHIAANSSSLSNHQLQSQTVSSLHTSPFNNNTITTNNNNNTVINNNNNIAINNNQYQHLNGCNSSNGFVKSLSPDQLSCSASTGIVASSTCSASSVVGISQSSTTSSAIASAAASCVSSDMNSAQIIESIKLVLRVSGYGEDAVSEITSAMSTLASYGVLGVGLGLL